MLSDIVRSTIDMRSEYERLLDAYIGVIERIGLCCLAREANEEAVRVIERGRTVLLTSGAPAAGQRR